MHENTHMTHAHDTHTHSDTHTKTWGKKTPTIDRDGQKLAN